MKLVLKPLLIASAVFVYLHSQGQNNVSGIDLIGRPVPAFNFNQLMNASTKNISSKGLKGRPFIIDFWPTWCTPCIKTLPILDSLQNLFKGQAQILSVCYNNKEAMREIFGRMLEKGILKYKLLPAAFDSSLFNKVKMGDFISMWVDANGIVRYFSPASRINAVNIDHFINGSHVQELEDITLSYKQGKGVSEAQQSYDDQKALLVDNNGDADSNYLFRSILTPYLKNIEYRGKTGFFASKYSVPVFKTTNIPLIDLYAVAFRPQICSDLIGSSFNIYGKFLNWPLLEVHDLSKFKIFYPNKNLDSVRMNHYCYELTFPDLGQIKRIDQGILDSAIFYANPVKDTAAYSDFGLPTAHSIKMQQVMQQDLLNYFPYTVTIEQIPYIAYHLVFTGNKEQIKSKTDKEQNVTTQWGIKLAKQPISELIKVLWFYNQVKGKFKDGLLDGRETIILDKTGVDFNIDIDLNCKMDDWDAVIKELKKYGLDLVETRITIAAIKIRDK